MIRNAYVVYCEHECVCESTGSLFSKLLSMQTTWQATVIHLCSCMAKCGDFSVKQQMQFSINKNKTRTKSEIWSEVLILAAQLIGFKSKWQTGRMQLPHHVKWFIQIYNSARSTPNYGSGSMPIAHWVVMVILHLPHGGAPGSNLLHNATCCAQEDSLYMCCAV